MNIKPTEDEIKLSIKMEQLKLSLIVLERIYKKISNEIARKKTFKRSNATISNLISKLTFRVDCAHGVTRQERIRRDLKRCMTQLIFLDEIK